MFGRGNSVEIGDLKEDLILKTAGKVRILIGKQFIDLLEEIESLKQRIQELES